MKKPLRSFVWKIILFTFLFGISAEPARTQTGVPVGPTRCSVEENGHKRDVPCPDSDSGSGSSGSSGSEAGARLRHWADCKLFGKNCPPKTDKRAAAGHDLNEKGVAAYENRQWATAASYFQQALDNVPDNEVYQQNLVNAQNHLAAVAAEEKAERERQSRARAEAEEKARRQRKAAANNMMRTIQDFTKTLETPPLAAGSSGGLDFDAAVSPDATKKSDGLDFTFNTDPCVSNDPSVVDLCEAKTLTVDPARVKGTFTGKGTARFMTDEDLKSMNALARKLGWSEEEQDRLARALDAFDRDGTRGSTDAQRFEAWTNMYARENDPVLRSEAAKVGGVRFPAAGTQSTGDCTIFALANATGEPYGVVAARATKLVNEGEWRDAAERANPESVFKQGLNGYEVIMLAEAFGQAQVVASTAFVATLNEGRPILLGVVVTQKQPDNEYSQSHHEVVLTKTFQHNGETWFEMMDSGKPATFRRYLTEKELGVIMFENGVAVRPERETTPKLFRKD